MRSVDPPKPVQVRHGDAWHDGWLEAWRRDTDGWRAYVRFSTGVGLRRLLWVGAAEVKPSPI